MLIGLRKKFSQKHLDAELFYELKSLICAKSKFYGMSEVQGF